MRRVTIRLDGGGWRYYQSKTWPVTYIIAVRGNEVRHVEKSKPGIWIKTHPGPAKNIISMINGEEDGDGNFRWKLWWANAEIPKPDWVKS